MGLSGLGGPRRSTSRRGHRRPFTEINIVPLTDVVLVLLVIFMVTAQFIQQTQTGMDLNLPSATQVSDLDELHGIRVSVDRTGAMAVDGEPVATENLQATLTAVTSSPQQLVIVEGDRETVLQNVVTIMDAALAAGLPNVVLATAAQDQPLPTAAETAPTEPAQQAGDTPFVTPPPMP